MSFRRTSGQGSPDESNKGLAALSRLGRSDSSPSQPGKPSEPKLPKDGRNWPRRLLYGFNILLVLVLLAGLGGFGYAKWRFGQINTVDVGDVLNRDSGGSTMNVLLVGSDSRSDIDAGEAKKFGTADEVGPIHSDTIMILRVEPKEQRAAILSLPRDLWVPIYSPDGKDLGKEKINAAIQGGPDQLIKTISTNFNIPIDHYMQVDFNGFREIVGAVGGVPVRFDSPARDKLSGLNIDKAGCVVLSGDQALSYVRSRHYETYESGRWRADPRGDLSRIDRQQDFIRRVLRTAIDKGARNPITLNNLVGAGVKNVQLDKGFDLGDITKLARRFQSLDPSQVEMMTLPNSGSSTRVNGQNVSIQVVKQPDAQQTIDRFLNGPPKEDKSDNPAVPPGSVSVRVLNGSGVSGQASDAAASLKDVGFVVSGTGDGKTFSGAGTTIRYAKGQKAKAETLKRYVKGTVTTTEDATLTGVDTVLTTGKGFSVADPAAADTSTTSTTAPEKQPEPSAAPDQSGC